MTDPISSEGQKAPGIFKSTQELGAGLFLIAVALLGRNTAIGTCLAALLFGALVNGTSVRNLDPAVFEPELAQNLTTVIQGMVVLFVSADVLILLIYNKLRPRRRGTAADRASAPQRRCPPSRRYRCPDTRPAALAPAWITPAAHPARQAATVVEKKG